MASFLKNQFVLQTEDDVDMINHPPHYGKNPLGIECTDVTRYMNFNLGNVVKYIWRSDKKENLLKDLKKAQWYLNDEILRIEEGLDYGTE